MNAIEKAQATVAELMQKRADNGVRLRDIDKLITEVSFSAHVGNDAKARKALSDAESEHSRVAVEEKSLAAAILVAESKVKEADAAARAEIEKADARQALDWLAEVDSVVAAMKLSGVLIDLYCASYAAPPQAVTLDIDDTCDVAHGHQQLSLFNAHYDERCFLPIHVYDTATGRPVAIILRPGKTPSGEEVRGHLRRIVRRIRAHWPTTKITIRGDGHYGRREVMDWCEDNGVEYVFGLSGNRIFAVAVDVEADDIRTRRALKQMLVLRGYAQTSYGAKSWRGERRVCARIEATELGLDIRYVVTNITTGSAEHIYDTLYCARGQMENLIKLHKSQLASDRTSCRSPLANQIRLILHTAAYWLMLELRDAIPKTHPLAVAEFVTLREKLLKIGAHIVETASRIKLALATACPQAGLFRHLADALQPAGP